MDVATYIHDSYVVVDLETTGLSPKRDEILEIGAVKVKGGVIVDRFQTFAKPKKKRLWPFAMQVNHISPDMVWDAPAAADAVAAFLAWAGDSPLVGHNIIGFDLRFLVAALRADKDAAERLMALPHADTYLLAKRVLTAEHWNLGTLYDMALAAGCTPADADGEAHRALYDAAMAAVLYEYEKAVAATQA